MIKLKINTPYYNIHAIEAAYIHVSDVCNFNCKICNLPIEKKGKFVSLGDLKKSIVIAKKLNLKNIIFTGQEVLMHPDFNELIIYSLEKEKMNYVTFNTNGLVFSNNNTIEKLKELKKYFDKIYFAISVNFYNKKNFADWSGHKEDLFANWTRGVINFLKINPKVTFDIILKKDIDIFKVLKFVKEINVANEKIELRILDLLPFGYTKGDVYKSLKYTIIERSILVEKIYKSFAGRISFESFPFCIFNQKDLFDKKYYIYNFHLKFNKNIPVQFDPNIYETSFSGKTENWIIDKDKLVTSYKNMFYFEDSCEKCYYKNICYGIETEYLNIFSRKEINNEIMKLKKINW